MARAWRNIAAPLAERGVERAERDQPQAHEGREAATGAPARGRRGGAGRRASACGETAASGLRRSRATDSPQPASPRGVGAQRPDRQVGALQRHGEAVARERRYRGAGVADPDAVGPPRPGGRPGRPPSTQNVAGSASAATQALAPAPQARRRSRYAAEQPGAPLREGPLGEDPADIDGPGSRRTTGRRRRAPPGAPRSR